MMKEIFCPYCAGESPNYMGTLGYVDHFRCRWCAGDFSVKRKKKKKLDRKE